jgi:predicted phage terminase large subunit-like protein
MIKVRDFVDFAEHEQLSPGWLSQLLRRLLRRMVAGFERKPRDHADGQPALGTLAWGQKYLAAHFAKPPSAMHRWLGTQLDACRAERGRKINLIGPRGGAKSTIGTLSFVLECAVEGRESYIWIVSDTKDQAQTHLENVKAELVDNDVLACDYPHATGKGPRWQAAAIELCNGVVIESYGTGQHIRGRRRRAYRPTLVVCDDLQNDRHIASAALRASTRGWFHGTLLRAGTRATNVVNLATALHRDALALELDTAAGWTSGRFPALKSWPSNLELWEEWERIYCDVHDPNAVGNARDFYERHRLEMDAGAEVLWPEVEDLYVLMQIRVESGRAAFEREKQGSPVDPELCEWPDAYFDDHIWFDSWPESLVVKAIALDPSKGQDARRGDYSAYVMLGIDAAGLLYVEADLARRATPQMVVDGAAFCARFRPHVFGVEANQYQELLAGEIAAEFGRQGLAYLVPAGVYNTVNKQVRIRKLGPYLSQRRFRFLARSASTKLLVNQLRDFPPGAHDDGPDALEMAVRLAVEVWHGRNMDDGLGNSLIFE